MTKGAWSGGKGPWPGGKGKGGDNGKVKERVSLKEEYMTSMSRTTPGMEDMATANTPSMPTTTGQDTTSMP